jgi:predicted negative regulator of RcsB-dependent stress response
MEHVSLRLSVLALSIGLLGCTPTPSNGSKSGIPTAAHYDAAMTAISAHSEPDAKAALAVLRSDVLQAQSNSLSVEGALVILRRAGSAVDQGNWDAARDRLVELQSTYGRPSGSAGS